MIRIKEELYRLKSKLQLLGKNIVEENDFALAVKEAEDRIRIYKLKEDNTLNKYLSEFIFERCELRKHFILTLNKKPRYKAGLYVKQYEGDILGGLKVLNLKFGECQDLPVIGAVLGEGALICNEYGDIHIIKLSEDITPSSSIVIIENPLLEQYAFILIHKEQSGQKIQIPLAEWDFKYTNFKKLA